MPPSGLGHRREMRISTNRQYLGNAFEPVCRLLSQDFDIALGALSSAGKITPVINIPKPAKNKAVITKLMNVVGSSNITASRHCWEAVMQTSKVIRLRLARYWWREPHQRAGEANQ